IRLHHRLLQTELLGRMGVAALAVALRDLDLLGPDRLGRGRTELLADDARGVHRPGEATALVVEGSANFERGDLLFGIADFLVVRDATNRARRTGGAAEGAGVLAVADARDEDWRPDCLDAPFHEGRVQGVIGADLHALAALDAALEELFLGERTRR